MLGDKTRNTPKSGQPKYPTFQENLGYYITEYCVATTIHGIKYVGERGRLLVERLVWICMITIVAGCCIFLITQTYNKWVTTPVIVAFDTTETPIFQIPFPAVTVLPEVNCFPEKFNYTDILLKKKLNQSLTEKESEYFESFSLICDTLSDLTNYGIYEDLGNFTTTTDMERRMNDLIEANPFLQFEKSLLPSWQEKEDSLQVTFTDAGLSFSFNMLKISEVLNFDESQYVNSSLYKLPKGTKIKNWTLDEGYNKDDSRDTFPKRSFVPGMRGGFKLIGFTARDHVKYSCNNVIPGYKVMLHHPCELPNLHNHFRLPLNQAVFVAIKPKMISISERLRNYKSEERKCFLGHERKLKYFKYYTQENCMAECYVNQTQNTCKCLPPSMYLFHYKKVPICGRGSMSCVYNVKGNRFTNENENHCNCLPSCTSLEYEVEISQTDWDIASFIEFQKMLKDIDSNLPYDYSNYSSYHASILFVYYKEMQFLAAERKELYGYVDFFSNTGGLLGLFIGISVTSAIEIIYFLTLRLACNILKFGRWYWSGAPELINS